MQTEVNDQSRLHAELAVAQQQLSRRFKGFHEMAANLTYHLEGVGLSLIEQKNQLTDESVRVEPAVVAPAVTCPPADHSDVFALLEQQDREVQQFQDKISHGMTEAETELNRAVVLQQEENAMLRKRVAELERLVESSEDKRHEVETALQQCVTLEEAQQAAKGIASEVAENLLPVAPTGLMCFDDTSSLQRAVASILESTILPHLSQMVESRFTELASISEQVNNYLSTHEQKKRELSAVHVSKDDTPRDCLIEEDVRTIISYAITRECSTLSTAALGIDELVSSALAHVKPTNKESPLTLPPDHAQRGAGGEVVYALTSPTFSRTPELAAVVSSSEFPPAKVASAYIWDFMSHVFNSEDGIGKPEEAISHKVTLGQCWAMTVLFYF